MISSPQNLTSLGGSLEDWLVSQMARHADFFRSRPVLLDVGAYHGEFSRQFVEGGCFREAILCEPNPDNFRVLQEEFGAKKEYHLAPKACGDAMGGAKLVCRGELCTGSLLAYEGEVPGPKKEHPVDVIMVDELLAGDRYGRLGLIKCDTQGNDLRVLKGAVETLRRHRPWLAVEMLTTPRFVHQACAVEVTQFLAEEKYFLAAQFNEFYTATGWLAWYDACFVPQELFSMERTANFPRPTADGARAAMERKGSLGRKLGRLFNSD